MVAPAMPGSADAIRLPPSDWSARDYAPLAVALTAFGLLFAEPARTLARDWWINPDAGHGLLLFPVSAWLAWKAGLVRDRAPQPRLGTAVMIAAVALRYLSGLAAELFTMRFSMWLAAIGVVVFAFGLRQVRHWWLPASLMLLSIPLPATITNSLAIPLQFRASKLGTALIEWRNIPVRTNGNVISIPGQTLFIAEACSGLRSLTALVSLGVMIGGIWLRSVTGRVALIALTIPIAIVVNSFRIFLTAFLMYFVDPALGRGFMHESEGWALFVVAFGLIGGVGALIATIEQRAIRWRTRDA
ncbi:MAG: exosortase/archaeosortase family protein [Gemmatimonadales bacterium]|nr:exosortase/archaeosortase family protein [Gemmatimonadales bacterium]